MAPNHTNQIFVVMPDAHLEVLREHFGFSYDHRADAEHSVVRFCTSWATAEGNVDALIAMIEGI